MKRLTIAACYGCLSTLYLATWVLDPCHSSAFFCGATYFVLSVLHIPEEPKE